MPLPERFYGHFHIAVLAIFLNYQSFSQCSPQTASPPPGSNFVTGGDGPGAPDYKWQIASDSITGLYEPALVMSSLPSVYYNNTTWISFSTSGEHSGDRFFFYKMEFNLPCFNLCGKSYNDDNAFCLNLDLYADNSIFEIFVNQVPQSGNLGGIIPLPDPFNPAGHSQSDRTAVSLCRNWRAGKNSIIIQVASSATVAGLNVRFPKEPPPPPDADSILQTICEGQRFRFGETDLTESGSYVQVIHKQGGCDSNIVLKLTVKPKSFSVINQVICKGETFLGHTSSGTYVETYPAANGCDSVRTLNLTVQGDPDPVLGNEAAICPGDSFLLSPGPYESYLWQDGSTQDHYVVKVPGRYSVTVTGACGTATDDIMVVNGICDVYFPDAFSPNKDGKNDYFKAVTDFRLQEYRLSIYNRWGRKIFETTDPLNGWNGTINGNEQQPGPFFWMAAYSRLNILTRRKGTVMLVR